MRTAPLGAAVLVAVAILSLTGALAPAAAPPKLPVRPPAELGFAADSLAKIDAAVDAALADQRMPGCVVVVGRRAGVAWRKAYGQRRLEPQPEPMTVDTVFDLASLTKPLATGLAVMILVDEQQLRFDAPAAEYWPEFAPRGKDAITLRQLLLHTGGLIADNPLADYGDGPELAWRRIADLRPLHPPGARFIYSDVSFLTLGQVAERVSGQPLDEFTQRRIYQPLGLSETGFRPAAELCVRAAPTQRRAGAWMQGEVHDPRAFAVGGVAGHAGLFSTADDLGVLAAMLLGRGEYAGVRIVGEETWRAMTTPQLLPPTARSPADGPSAGKRGLGWDMQSGFSSNRGRTFSPAAFGHGGFTGTSFWVDPERDLFVIFLSNRVHPNGQGAVNALAGEIGTLAGAALE